MTPDPSCQFAHRSGRFRMLSLIGLWLISSTLYAQDFIYLENASFEGHPAAGNTPPGWYDCGFSGHTPPDIQPSINPDSLIFGNAFPPYHGQTYLAMVVRNTDSWERVSHPLSSPLKKGEEYHFRIFLARPEYYLSQNLFGKEAQYTSATVLKVYGGNKACELTELLCQSTPVEQTEWIEHTLTLRPDQDYQWLSLEAFYTYPTLFPNNGCLFLDNCSPIYPASNEDANRDLDDILSLLRRIRNCDFPSPLPDTLSQIISEVEILKRSMSFDHFLNDYGMAEYLRTRSIEEIQKDISCFKQMQLPEMSNVIRALIRLKTPLSTNAELQENEKKQLDYNEGLCKAFLNGGLVQKSRHFARTHMKKLEEQIAHCPK